MFNAVWRTWLKRRSYPSRLRYRLSPRLEQLEDRVVPAGPTGTITINDVSVIQSFVGQSVSGTLNPGTQANTYRLNGFAGERVNFHWVSGSSGLGTWYFYGPADNFVGGNGFGNDFVATLPSDGPYNLVLTGNQTTAEPYNFQTTDVTDQPVAVAGFDVEHSGNLPANSTVSFTYSAPAGRVVLFDGLSNSFNVSASLQDPAGNPVISVNSGNDSAPLALPRSGTYTLTLSNNTASSQPFDFKLLDFQGSATVPLVLGVPVSGTPSTGYSDNVYSFQGAVGQRVFFDGQGGNDTFYLYGPGGVKQLFVVNSGSDSSGPVTLLESGTYYLVGYNNSGTVTQFSWQLLDRAAAQTLDLAGGNTQGTLTPGNSAQLFQFNGTAGTRLFFNWQTSSTGGGYYEVFGPDNSVLTGNGFGSYQYFGNAFDLTLPADGQYTLALFGQNGATALPYQFNVYTPPAPVSNAAYVLGQTVNGNLATAGQIDTYTFTGAPGQRLYFDGLADSSSSSIYVTITSPTGIVIPGQSSTANDLTSRPFTLTEGGSYRVRIQGNAQNTGTYSFRLLDRAAAPALDLAGGSTQGTLSPGNSAQLFQFTGSAGTRLFFNWQSASTSNAYYQLFGPDGNAVNGTGFGSYQYFGNPFDVVLPVDGPYTLALIGQNAGTPSPFQFQVYTPPVPVNGVGYALGQTVSGNLATAGQIDTYAFAGSPGQRLFFDGLGDSTNGNINVTIKTATGNVVLNQYNTAADLNGAHPFTLTATGTYIMTVQAAGQNTGTYSFRLLDRAAAPVLDLAGGTTQGALSPGNSAQLFQLNGTAGTRLFFNWQSTSTSNGYYQLFGPDGTAVNSAIYGSYQYFGNPFDVTLPVDGPYTLVLFGQVAAGPTGPPAPVGYQFQVATPPTPVRDVSYTIGQTISGNLAAAGQIDTYTFSESLGQRIFFDGLSDSTNGNIRAVLTSPSGAVIDNDGASQDQDGVTITEPGTYRLTVRANGQLTGTYGLRLLDTSSATSLSLPATINATAGGNSFDLYTFNGLKGQTINASLPTSTGNSAFFVLYNLNGQRASQFGTTGSAAAGLPADGTYLIAVFSNSSSPVTYSFNVSATASIATPTGFNTVQTGTLANNASQQFQFNAPAGRVVYFDSLAQNFNVSYSVTSPSSSYVTSGSLGGDSGPVVLPSDGLYTLTLTNTSGSSQNYSFRLLDLATAATPYAVGSPVNNATATGFGADVYTFSGTVGQTLVYDGLADSSNGSMAYYVIGPGGNTVYSGQTQYDSTNPLILLSEAGTYYLIQSNTQNAASTYGYRLLDTAAGTSLSLNAPVTDTLTPGGSANVYRLSGNAGQRVLVSFTAGSGSSYYLYGTTGNLVSSNSVYAGSFINATLPVGGTYVLIVGGDPHNATPVTYTFQASTPAVNNRGNIALGNNVAGNIASPGQVDQYSIVGTAGQSVYFDGMTGDAAGQLFVHVLTPSGDNLFSYYPAYDQGPYTLSETGTYTITVSASNNGPATGTYSFRLLDVASAPVLSLNTPTGSTLTPGTSTQLYAFSRTAGQTIFFNTLSGSGGSVYLYDPNGRVVDSTGLGGYFQFTIPLTGNYLLALQGSDVNNPVAYNIELFDAPTNTLSYTPGTTATGIINTPGQADHYTFTGTAGQQLYLDGITGSNLLAVLTAPSGSADGVSYSYLYSDNGPFTLAESGTFTLTVSGNTGPTTGAYSFRLADVASAQALAFNTPAGGTLTPGTSTQLYAVSGTAGQTVFFNTISGSGASVYLYGPSGQYVDSTGLGSSFRTTLPLTGTYLLSVQGNDTNNPVAYDIELFNSPVNTANYTLGSVATGSIDTPGQSDSYTFAGSVGQHLYFDGLTGSSGVYWVLTSPGAGTADVSNGYSGYDQGPFTLPASGTYTLTVGGSGGPATGPYSFQLLDEASQPEILQGATFTVTLSQANASPVTVNYATADNTAHAGVDYAATTGTITFNPGETTKTVKVFLIPDPQLASVTSFFVNLSGANGATIADSQGIATINTPPRPATQLTATGIPASVTAGSPVSWTVTARDSFGLIATTYTGTVAFSSSDLLAGLPANYTFTAADQGQHTFTLTFHTLGTQSVQVQDVAQPALTATQSGITIVKPVVSWSGGGDGTSWNDARNWSGGAVPTATDDVVINMAGTYTVNLNVDAAVNSLTLNAPTAIFQSIGHTFTVSSASTLTAGTVVWRNSTWAGVGTLTNNAAILEEGTSSITSPFVQNGALTIQGDTAGGNAVLTVSAGFTNNGTIAVQSANAAFQGSLIVASGTLTNAASGLLNFNAGTGGSRAFSGTLANNGAVNVNLDSVTFTGSITNNGTFIKAASAGTTSVAASFDNPGTVEVDAGTLSLAGSVAQLSANQLTGGTWNVLNSSALNLAGPQVVNNKGAITLGGPNAVFTSIAGLAQNSGTLNLLGGARLVVPASFDNAGTLFLDAGSAVVAGGNFVQDATGNITIAIGGNPGSGAIGQINASGAATLGGSLTTTQVNGFVPSLDQYFPFITFAGSTGDFASKSLQYASGQSYTTYQTGTQYFVTTQAPADHIVISQQPTTTAAGQTINAIQVSFFDAANNLVQTQPSISVTLALASGPGGATLGGTVTVTAVNGIASFSTLFLQKSGAYTLTASAAGFAAVTSQSFVITPGAATQLDVGGFPSTVVAGTAGNFTVTALDAFGNVATGFGSLLHFTSSDGQAVLAADASLTNGVGTFSATLKTAGVQALAATEVTATGTPLSGSQGSIQVDPGAAVVLSINGLPSPTTAGTPNSFTVTAFDAFSNVATSFNNPLHFTSSDNQALLPPDTTLTNGMGTFNVTFNTVGVQSVRITDTVLGLSALRAGITVNAATATHFTISGATGPIAAGVPQSIVVTAEDAFGNTSANYAGIVHFSSSDGQAVLPANATLTNGTGSFTVTFKTAGQQSVTAVDTVAPSITGSQSATVTAAAVTQFVLSGIPAAVTAGAITTVTISANDAFGNVATSYAGTVHFTSSDPAAALPADATLTQGSGSFDLVLTTAGAQSVTVSDSTGSPTASVAGITVNPAALNQITVTGLPGNLTAGASATISVTARDAFGNLATNYAGTIHFTSTDGQAVLPPDAGLAIGSGSFTVSLRTAGAQTVIATDTGTQLFCSETTTVAAGAATHLGLSAVPPALVAGGTGSLSVTALDAFGNTDLTYAGTLHFTSSDGQAALPPDSTLTQGVGSFNITLKTAGTQSIAAADVAGPVTGSLAGIVVNPAAPATLTVSGPPSGIAVAGTNTSLTISVQDAYGNLATNYRGILHFASSDTQAVLPTDRGLVNGVGAFAVTLKTAGSSTVSITDAANGLSFSQPVNVVPGPASVAVFSGLAASTPVGATQNFTITIEDAFGNVMPDFTGSAAFSSSDSAANLPATYAFVAADEGSHAFAVTFNTVGTQTITATLVGEAGAVASQQTVTAVPGAVATAIISGFPSLTTPGIPAAFSVTLKDAFGNVATNFTGTVAFSTSDPQAVLPGVYTFTASDGGVHTFSAALATPGTQSITVAVQNGGVQGTLANLSVVDPQVSITGLDTARAGETYTLTLSATNLGTDAIVAWTISWGDGTQTDVVPGSTTTVTHVFTTNSDANGFSINVTAVDTRSVVLTVAPLVVLVTDDRVPTVSISGLDGVKVGETYTLTLSATNLGTLSILSWNISWGDGTAGENFAGNATTATHVYTNRDPNGFEIRAVATDSRQKVFTPKPLVLQLLTEGITERQVTSVAQGATATLKLTKIEATFIHNGAGDAVPSLAIYVGNITDTPFPGKVWVDFSVTNADVGDQAEVKISYDGDVQTPALFFFDAASHSWQKFSGKVTGPFNDPATPGRHFLIVTFDRNSNPPIHKLTGTIFTVAVSTAATEVSTTVSPLTVSNLQGVSSAGASFLTNSQLSLSLTPLQQSQLSSSRSGLTGEGPNSGTEEEKEKEAQAETEDLWQIINDLFTNPPAQSESKSVPPATGAAGEPGPATTPGATSGRRQGGIDVLDRYFADTVGADATPAAASEVLALRELPPLVDAPTPEDYRRAAVLAFLGLASGGRFSRNRADKEEQKRRILARD